MRQSASSPSAEQEDEHGDFDINWSCSLMPKKQAETLFRLICVREKH
jgi:hypothetical protein